MKSFDKWFNQQGKGPTLGDIVLDIANRSGINRADVDVSNLDDLLPDGLYGKDGAYKFRCRGCDRECDYDGEPADFTLDGAYGACSPGCLP